MQASDGNRWVLTVSCLILLLKSSFFVKMNFSRGVGGSLSHLWKFRRGGGSSVPCKNGKSSEVGGS